jgi:hypothetical protein
MRNGQNKRMRGRNRKGHNPLSRVHESNGPDVKIRGTASHIAEKYVQLARDAQASGDPVAAENYYQHAEHYFRIIAAAQEQFRQNQPFYRPEGGEQPRGDDPQEGAEEGGAVHGEPYYPQRDFRDQQPYPREQQQHQPYPPREQQQHQPYPPREQQFQPGGGQHIQQPRDPQPQGGRGDDVSGLPAFITGTPQPSQSFGPNGYDNQADRFPLHRRRRRHHHHRGPRDEMSGGQPGLGGDSSDDAPPPAGPQPTNE